MRAVLAAIALSLAATACSTQRPIHLPELASANVRIQDEKGVGSGVYIGNGVIITAAHVVGDRATVTIKSDAGDVQSGDVLWTNKAYDIAAVRPSNAKRFMTARLDCRTVVVGESVEASGNPMGLEFITMHGYVSGKERELAPNWKAAFIVDMTTIGGMSGGAVVDAAGSVIGITVGTAAQVEKEGGMGFVVPSSAVCAMLGRV